MDEQIKVAANSLEQKKYIGASTEQLDGIEKIKSVMKELAKKITTAKPTTALFEETQVTVSKFEKLIVEISERAKILSKLDSYPNELLAKVPKVFELQVKNALSKDPATKTYKQVLQDVRSNTASMEDLNSAKKSLTEVFDRLVDEQKQLITAVTEYWKEISQKIQKIQKGFASFAAEPLQVVETTISRVNKAASSAEPMEKHLLEQAKAKIDSRLIVALRLLERLQVILPNKVSMELRNTDEVIREQWKKLMGLLAIDPLDKEQLTVVCDRMESRQSFLRTVKEEGDKIKDLSTRVTEAIKLTKHEALRGEWEKLNQVFFTEPFVGENLEKLVESLEKWLLQLKTAIEKGRLLETARGAVTQRSTFTVDSRCIKALRDDGEERIAIAVFGGKSAITWNPHALGKKSGHDWTGWNSMQYKAGDGNYVLIYKFEGRIG